MFILYTRVGYNIYLSFLEYIALDDLQLNPGECEWTDTTLGPSSSTPAPDTTINCTFEVSLCGWRQDMTDGDLDWYITTGELVGVDIGGTNILGPATDHTTHLSEGKHTFYPSVHITIHLVIP